VEERPVEGSNVDPSVSFRVYPNPMTSLAHFRIQAPGNTKPSLKIYDITGRLVRDLSSKLMPRMKEVVWDGRDEVGNVLPSGVYLCRLEGEGFEPRHQAVVLTR
jgi:flagellar hook assembly protein FlgD